MRKKELFEQVRAKAWDTRNGLLVPRHDNDIRSTFPVCQHCHREVEAVELKNENAWSVELWARCHGKEDFYTIKYPFRIEDGAGEVAQEMKQTNIRAAMRAFAPFGNPEL